VTLVTLFVQGRIQRVTCRENGPHGATGLLKKVKYQTALTLFWLNKKIENS
jgi:hypothetical protein